MGLTTPAGTKCRKPTRTKQEQYGSAINHGANHRENTQRHKIMQVIPA